MSTILFIARSIIFIGLLIAYTVYTLLRINCVYNIALETALQYKCRVLNIKCMVVNKSFAG